MQVIHDIILTILLSLIPATANQFLDYCLGKPMSEEYSMKEIFFPYSFFLAKRRVTPLELIEMRDALKPMLTNDDPAIRSEGEEQLKRTIFLKGRDRFYWEKAVGMCPFCTNFWFCMIAATVFYFTIPLNFIDPLFFFLLVPIFSHSILRKL
jgi:hypothetical protein